MNHDTFFFGSNLNLLLVQLENKCNFFDSFGIFVQAILGLITIGILMCKRYLENPRRTWKVWFFDTSKQAFGQLTQHILNLIISSGLGDKSGYQCEWYVLNIINDLTIGVLIVYFYLKLFECVLRDEKIAFKSGDYGETPSFNQYFYQLFLWIIIVILSKLTNSILMIVSSKFIEIIGIVMLLPFKDNLRLKFIFVMIIYPLLFTAMQFWITDNIIKKKSDKSEIKKSASESNLTNMEHKNLLDQNDGQMENMSLLIENDSITKPLLEKV